MFKTANIGTADRAARLLVGTILILLAWLSLSGAWAWAAGIIGLVLILTALVRFCPLYRLFGTSTCPAR